MITGKHQLFPVSQRCDSNKFDLVASFEFQALHDSIRSVAANIWSHCPVCPYLRMSMVSWASSEVRHRTFIQICLFIRQLLDLHCLKSETSESVKLLSGFSLRPLLQAWVAAEPMGKGQSVLLSLFWRKAQPPEYNRSLFWVAFITGAPAGYEGLLQPHTYTHLHTTN